MPIAVGERRYVRKSEQHYKLFFKLRGCCSGQQHYRHCTPRAITKESDLWCPFCMYCAWQWTAVGKALITRNELQLMSLLRACGYSEKWCHQVRHDIWCGCFDFWNWCENVYVQVDGVCHWRGMHTNSSDSMARRDLSCNFAAFHAHVGLVRVHESDLQQPQTIMAAMAAAATEQCVVFTSTYINDACTSYLKFIEAVHMYRQVCYDTLGNTICKWISAYPVLIRLAVVLTKSVVLAAKASGASGELEVHQAIGAGERGMG